MIAGLEAELTFVVAACVMLRRNIDTKQGLVSGAIGTVTCISSQKLIIKFDHDPYPIEMARGKFMYLRVSLFTANTVSSHYCVRRDNLQVSGVVP